ncbi:MAG: hypothetical protein U0610_08695 [bacterium]
MPRAWFNLDLKSRWFYVPAIMPTILPATMILPSMAVVREKENGTCWSSRSVTLCARAFSVVAKLLPFFGIAILDLFAVTALGIPLPRAAHGNSPRPWCCSIPFILTALGLGLLTSTLVRTWCSRRCSRRPSRSWCP